MLGDSTLFLRLGRPRGHLSASSTASLLPLGSLLVSPPSLFIFRTHGRVVHARYSAVGPPCSEDMWVEWEAARAVLMLEQMSAG
jgi:hypothetical protein